MTDDFDLDYTFITESARARHSHHYHQIVADASLAEKGGVGVCISSSGSTSSEDDKALRHREHRGSWSGYSPVQRLPPVMQRKHTMEIMEAPLEEPNNTDVSPPNVNLSNLRCCTSLSRTMTRKHS